MTIAVAAADDWPTFRGNALQNGVAVSGLPEQLQVLWRFQPKKMNPKDQPPSFESTAAIVGDTAYIGGMDGYLYALNLNDGQEKWRYKATDAIRAAPAVKGGAVFIGDLAGVFHCVDAAKGTSKWTFNTDGEIIPSATFAGDKVLFGSADEFMYCLEAAGGKQVWKFRVPGGPINPSPAVVDGKSFATGCDSILHILNVDDGKEVGSVELPSQVGASPAIAGNMLYLGTMGRGVVGIDWKQAKTIWEYPGSEDGAEFYSSAAVSGDFVVLGGRDKRVHALDAKTGDVKWTFATRGRIDSSPVIVGERVFIGSKDGNLYSIDLKTGNKLWQEALGSPVTASPAVGSRKLIIGTHDGLVYCFGAK
jgi:outer membrane protein assembly factor BamB